MGRTHWRGEGRQWEQRRPRLPPRTGALAGGALCSPPLPAPEPPETGTRPGQGSGKAGRSCPPPPAVLGGTAAQPPEERAQARAAPVGTMGAVEVLRQDQAGTRRKRLQCPRVPWPEGSGHREKTDAEQEAPVTVLGSLEPAPAGCPWGPGPSRPLTWRLDPRSGPQGIVAGHPVLVGHAAPVAHHLHPLGVLVHHLPRGGGPLLAQAAHVQVLLLHGQPLGFEA